MEINSQRRTWSLKNDSQILVNLIPSKSGYGRQETRRTKFVLAVNFISPPFSNLLYFVQTFALNTKRVLCRGIYEIYIINSGGYIIILSPERNPHQYPSKQDLPKKPQRLVSRCFLHMTRTFKPSSFQALSVSRNTCISYQTHLYCENVSEQLECLCFQV